MAMSIYSRQIAVNKKHHNKMKVSLAIKQNRVMMLLTTIKEVFRWFLGRSSF